MNEKQLMELLKIYEKKLKEYMPEEEFYKFSVDTAKNLFEKEVNEMADSEIKQFIKEHFDEITGTNDEFQNLMESVRNDKHKDNPDGLRWL